MQKWLKEGMVLQFAALEWEDISYSPFRLFSIEPGGTVPIQQNILPIYCDKNRFM
jgi:hypothetical protein